MDFSFHDWTQWLASTHPDELVWIVLPMLLLDVPRYTLGVAVVWACDYVDHLGKFLRGKAAVEPYRHCPSLCVIVAGLNEADTVGQTLESLWGSYPRMEIVVVDDGSTDGMSRIAREFAIGKRGVTVLRKPRRGGKSSALNFALPFTQAEIIVCVDADSQLGETALWEIVQPFCDPEVAAVSGTILVRSPFCNLLTWLQASEYLRSIFLGRLLTSRLGILGIVSGAFGGYRRDVLCQLGGWDVGPGEDGDLALRIRKSGYRIAFAPYAQCFTNPPVAWRALFRQRRRWEWAVVTLECRKHIDLANVRGKNFRWSNLALLLERWLCNIFLQVAFWVYVFWCATHPVSDLIYQLFFLYVLYLLLELVQVAIIVFYSIDRRRDLLICLVTPLMPFYHLAQRIVGAWSVLEEMTTRRSYRDAFVPEHVRRVTWHW